MKILLIAPAFRPATLDIPVGGGEISNRLLMKALAERGHRIVVVAVDGAGEPRAQWKGVTIVEARRRRYGRAADTLLARLRYGGLARRIARDERPDVVLAATSGLAVALKVARAQRVPLGIFVRAFENFAGGQGKDRSVRARIREAGKRAVIGDVSEGVLRQVDFIVACSAFMKACCARIAPRVRTYVVYPPVTASLRPVRRDRRIERASMVGTSEKKGRATVEELALRLPDLQFRIVGAPNVEEERAVTSNLTIAGWTDMGREFGERADIVLVPTLGEEPFGRVAIEGLAAGAIVLAADAGGLPEALLDERLLLIGATDVDGWEARLRGVAADPRPYREACARARAQLPRFTLERQADALEQLLRAEGARQPGAPAPAAAVARESAPLASEFVAEVTVVIPAYRNRDRIGAAIASVLAQPDVRTRVVVVIDDQCRETEAIARAFGAQVTILWNERNRGAQYSRNAGLATVETPFVMFLDSDDWIEGRLLAGVCEAMAGADADLGFGPWVRFDEASQARRWVDPPAMSEAELFSAWMTGARYVPPCSVVWRSERLREIGGWDEEVRRNQDGELVMRALLRGLRFTAGVGGAGVYVHHAGPHRVSRQSQNCASLLLVIDKLLAIEDSRLDVGTVRRAAARGYYEVARRAFREEDWALGRRALGQARAQGFRGHRGSLPARLVGHLVGLERRMRWTARQGRSG